ncbi:DUF5324 family protein [Streptomyces bambusae]|uniref:Transcriptional regulator n=1 Tax=Streptomyces bambusae TaxID=1550616 RepID=A0ABS6Z9W7_9ACTN|nr:DUF5324 family protein [Streptomyces bambusae]MBW5484559.1 transcriptional regulator [Streptomyces bambusae]
MTPKESVRAAAESARESARHAADAMAPYVGNAKDAAVHYAHEANERFAPMVAHAAHEGTRHARNAYDTHLHPRMKAARAHVPPNIDHAATRAACRTREAVKHAAAVTQPRLEHALAAAQPVAEEAASRSTAALAALRGQVSAHEVERLVRARERRARCGRALKGVVLVGLLAGAAFAAWKWWDQQSNPDWLVEPPAATEVPASLDDELAAKEREASAENDEQK